MLALSRSVKYLMELAGHKAYNSAWCCTYSKNPLRPLTDKLFVYRGWHIFVSIFLNLLNGSVRKLKVCQNRRNDYFL